MGVYLSYTWVSLDHLFWVYAVYVVSTLCVFFFTNELIHVLVSGDGHRSSGVTVMLHDFGWIFKTLFRDLVGFRMR